MLRIDHSRSKSIAGHRRPRSVARRGARLAIGVLCKLAFLLTIVQPPPTETAQPEESESVKVTEKCVAIVSSAVSRRAAAAHGRGGTSRVARHSPITVRQRLSPNDSSHGHVLSNGLRAPLRC
jgi:hypothetical protein